MFPIKEANKGGMRHIYANVDNPGVILKDLAIAVDVILYSIIVVIFIIKYLNKHLDLCLLLCNKFIPNNVFEIQMFKVY